MILSTTSSATRVQGPNVFEGLQKEVQDSAGVLVMIDETNKDGITSQLP